MHNSKVRIGIDVGGTFTHAVCLNAETLTVIGRSKVPTTHSANEGVALGIIDALTRLLEETKVAPEDVSFIAHSTTQATNALLEGDVAPVGILCLGDTTSSVLTKASTRLGKIRLAKDKYLQTYFRFVGRSRSGSAGEIHSESAIKTALTELVECGAKAIAVTQAFSVDDPSAELRALSIAREMKLLATSGAEVSQLYGLKVRTRTAVINAAMLPKMIESANMTETSVRNAGIIAPLMIMRSDGGVMDIEAMRKRPILTMLSGPAAGVAAAMMYLKISDGVFLEVGGTSTDISAISNGKAQIRSGEVGEHRVYMRTLDVRTVGVAGGSVPRISSRQIVDVGPRSAHIAGMHYVAFTDSTGAIEIEQVKPRSDDPADYMAIKEEGQTGVSCLTPTCASNFLGLVPAGDCASGNQEHISKAFAALSAKLGKSDKELAEEILTKAALKCMPVVKQLIRDHKLDPAVVTLVGGGGGAAAIVPFVASLLKMPFRLAEQSDIISAIGVALALIRETVERQIINPTNADILNIRADAFAAVEKMGADPASIEIHVEIDNRANIVRATAFGATSMVEEKSSIDAGEPKERLELLSQSFRVAPNQISLVNETRFFQIYSANWVEHKLSGLLKMKKRALRVLDMNGTIRLQVQDGTSSLAVASQVSSEISDLIEKHSQWGDAGKIIPDILLLIGGKIVDLSGLLNGEQVNALAKVELDEIPNDSPVVVIAKFK